MLAVPDQVGREVGPATPEVGVELGDQRGHRAGECASMVIERQRSHRVGVDDRVLRAQAVPALDPPRIRRSSATSRIPSASLDLSLDLPMLVLQGSRDHQVTVADDLARWGAGLAHRSNVTIRVHEADNHLSFPGSGPSTPAEYEAPQPRRPLGRG
nr:hypothetical protein GCM10020241_08120 [Streptoalloteichus tenebrarius]